MACMKQSAFLLALPFLAACSTTMPDAGDPVLQPATNRPCDVSNVQDRVGEQATTALGEELLGATSARSLRWIPPRSAVTMDYRPDRLNVSYDDSFTILRIYCG